MYETLEFYNDNGFDLKEVLKNCIYNYYIENCKNKNRTFVDSVDSSIMKSTNKVEVLSKKGAMDE